MAHVTHETHKTSLKATGQCRRPAEAPLLSLGLFTDIPAAAAAAAVGPGRPAEGPGGGRPQRVPVKLIKYKEKTEMRETRKNQDLTGNLLANLTFLPRH